MKKEFVLRGQTPDAGEEVLNFSGHKKGYAYKMTEFKLYPSSAIGIANDEMSATISAGKTGIDPTAPNFNDEALVATALSFLGDGPRDGPTDYSVINETFLITQNLILKVKIQMQVRQLIGNVNLNLLKCLNLKKQLQTTNSL